MTIKLFQNPRTKKIFLIILAIAIIASAGIVIIFIVINWSDIINGGT